MKRLVIHIGLDKCASTSVQKAFSLSQSICYPVSGINLYEHLVVALHIRGLDSYTAQYYDQAWVDNSWTQFMQEISSATHTIVISSERLASFSLHEINILRERLYGFKVEILLLVRNVEAHSLSRWRHLVSRHDYPYSYSDFILSHGHVNVQAIEASYSQFFPVTTIDIDDESWQSKLSSFIGCSLEIEHIKSGMHYDIAEALVKIHSVVGTKTFQELFPDQLKEDLVEASNANISRASIVEIPQHCSALMGVCSNDDYQLQDGDHVQQRSIPDLENALLKLKTWLLERKSLERDEEASRNILMANTTSLETLRFRLAEATVQILSLRQMLALVELNNASQG